MLRNENRKGMREVASGSMKRSLRPALFMLINAAFTFRLILPLYSTTAEKRVTDTGILPTHW